MSIKIINHLNLLPQVTSVHINNGDESFVSTVNYRLDAKDDSRKNAWFLDKKIISFINFKMIFCFSREIYNDLLKNQTLLFSGIPDGFYSKDDYQVIEKKIAPGNVNIIRTTDSVLSYSFSEEVKRQKRAAFFGVFLVAAIDNNEIAVKYKINSEKLTSIIGTFEKEIFIENNQVTNNKVLDVSIFKQKEKIKINLDFIEDILSSNLKNQIINLNDNYFSSVDFSFNEEEHVTLLYSIKINKLIKDQSRYKFFFENSSFEENYFQNKSNFLPQHIIIKRFDTVSNKDEVLYDGKFIESYSSKDFSFDLLKFNQTTIWIGIKDKNTKNLNNIVQYNIELIFEDKTISILEDIKNSTLEELNKIESIINIAWFGNYFQEEINCFKPSLYEDLQAHNLSIQSLILNTAKILSQFRNFNSSSINSIIQLSKSQYFNLEILESIKQILSYLKAEITLLQNDVLFRTNKFSIKNASQKIELQTSKNKISIFETNQLRSVSQISGDYLIDRLKIENDKYYKNNNIENKNLFFSPLIISVGERKISQKNKINELDYDLYNSLLIDLFYLKIFKNIPYNISNYEKLTEILFYYGITFEIETEETTKTNEITNRYGGRIEPPKAILLNERLLLQIFLQSIVYKKNSDIFSFKNIDPKSDSTKKQLVDISKAPIQSRSIIESLQDNQFTVLKREELSSNINDIFKNFALYLNYKHLYTIEFLDNDFKWKELSFDQIKKNDELICRYVPYYNENLDIKQDLEMLLANTNDIFILSNNISIPGRGRNPTQKDVPFLDDIYALYPFGSIIYGTDRDISDFDFILVTKSQQKLTNNVIKHNDFNYNIVSADQYLKDLNNHEIYALETYFLPDSLITLKPSRPWSFKLDKSILKRSIKAKMEKSLRLAAAAFAEKDFRRGKKRLFYGLNSAIFAKQIFTFGKITNYSEGNYIWNELNSSTETDWRFYEKKYKKLYDEFYLALGN